MLKMLLILFCFQFSMYIIRVDEVHGCCITNGAGGRKGAGSDRQDVASWLGPGFRTYTAHEWTYRLCTSSLTYQRISVILISVCQSLAGVFLKRFSGCAVPGWVCTVL